MNTTNNLAKIESKTNFYFNVNKFESSSKKAKVKITNTIIRDTWKYLKPELEQKILVDLNVNKNTEVLYYLQFDLNHLLLWAEKNKDYQTLDEIANLLLLPLKGIDQIDTLPVNMGGRDVWIKYDTPQNIWLHSEGRRNNRYEVPLYTSQYLYFATKALNIFSKVPKEKKTFNILKYIESYTPIVKQSYKRWVLEGNGCFQVSGWGCDGNNYNHWEFLKKKKNNSFKRKKPTYCQSITDTDLWITAGTVEMLMFNIEQNILSSSDLLQFQKYLDDAFSLFESRMTKTELTNWDGGISFGYDFDIGVWDEHPSYKYSFSENKDVLVEPINTSWDISHACRFVLVFDTFFEYQQGTDIHSTNFPEKENLVGLANQFAYAVFNQDLENPKFTNFFGGQNGWYRVGYNKSKGLPPYRLSSAFLYGGYGWWAKYNKDINQISESVLSQILDDTKQLPLEYSLLNLKNKKEYSFETNRLVYLMNFFCTL